MRLTLKNKKWACRLTTAMYNKLFDLENVLEEYNFDNACDLDIEIRSNRDKVYKYESIEKELGIDLIKAVELCKQVNNKKVVYTKEKWGIIDRIRIQDKLDIGLLNHRLYSNNRGVYVSFDLHKYGKTWALTREELQ